MGNRTNNSHTRQSKSHAASMTRPLTCGPNRLGLVQEGGWLSAKVPNLKFARKAGESRLGEYSERGSAVKLSETEGMAVGKRV